MSVSQISVFIENKPGHLAEFTGMLKANNVDIKALSIADTEEYGVLRMMFNDPDKTEKIIKDNGYLCRKDEVIGVMIDDTPGSLHTILSALAENNIGIEYIYAFNSSVQGYACMVVRVDDNEKAEKTLLSHGIKVMSN